MNWGDSNINLAWLATFECAARTLSFTKAAQELGLSQGAVSIQIRNLEDALGTALFVRRGRSLVLTDEGVAYYPQVSETLTALRATTSRLFSKNRRYNLAISSFSPTFSDFWLAPVLGQLAQKTPEVQFELTIDYQSSETRSAEDDLVFVSARQLGPNFIPLVEERLIAVCAPEYRDRVPGDWMQGLLIESVGARDSWASWHVMTGQTGRLGARVMRVNSMSAAIRLAETGAGAALVADAFVRDQLAEGRLVELAPGKAMPGRVHGLSAVNLPTSRPIVKTVVANLLAIAGQPIPHYLSHDPVPKPRR